MNDNIKVLLDEAAREGEPLHHIEIDELAQKGRQRKRRRFLSFTGAGTALTVAAVVAATLLMPVNAPGNEDSGPADDSSHSDDRNDPTWSMPADRLSDGVRKALTAAFPEAEHEQAPGWNVGDKPFDLTEGADSKVLIGFGQHKSDRQLVGVELYLPGEWSKKPSDIVNGDRDADEYLIDCGESTDGDTEISTHCGSYQSDDGLVRTAYQVEFVNDQLAGHSTTSVIYRNDGTAVVLRSECRPSMPCDPMDVPDTHNDDTVEPFLEQVPQFIDKS